MAFESINELDKFGYKDCQISDVSIVGKTFVFTVEALIVKDRNSQNANFTDSYADTAAIELKDANITSMVIEGYKQYDAEDNVVGEVADTVIPESEYIETLKKMIEGYMFEVECLEKGADHFKYSFEVDMDVVNEYGLQDPYSTTYQMEIEFSGSRVSWERYLNRVQ